MYFYGCKMLRKIGFIFLFVLVAFGIRAQQRSYQLSGVILDSDSATVIPFAYVINLNTGNGAVSNYDGRFSIIGKDSDTIIFSYLGYHKKYILVKNIRNINDSTKVKITVVLKKTMYALETFNVTAFKIKPYEREYMNRVINRPRCTNINALQSPITAMYEAFSHKGRANQKLADLYEQMLIDEVVEQKFNPEVLRKLTGDETIDFAKFKKYCYNINDYFIISNDGYDLYAPIMDCYKRWKKEGR